MSNNDKFDISCPPICEPIPFWGTRRAFMIHKSIDEYCENKEREMWFGKKFDDKFKVGDKTVSDQLNELFCKPFKRNKID
jgi:hypothetical protein